MRYLLTIILGLFLWTGCNDDDETLVPSTEPEFRYVLPDSIAPQVSLRFPMLPS